uniref:NADH-quinone oxidoreductase subunit E n=1 Tax=Candidatus Kentrum sp. TUN TaxID=2126343 RepID=A0A450ZAK5_9GAMM|nr:MAG: NADH-quinone oxidoreductase subunit E [Candidatus Kentron sp. TUN]
MDAKSNRSSNPKLDNSPRSLKHMLSEHTRAEIDRWLTKYPPEQKRSAILAALREAQHENDGYLTTDLMDAVATYLDLPSIAVYEVASFYSMLETESVGHHSISVCTNISCLLRGAEKIVGHVEKKLGVKVGESTSDHRFFLKREEECLAACCGAPMMMIDHKYYEDLTPEKVDEILENLK